MAIATAILEFLVGLVKAIPYFNKWFTKTPTQKVEDAKEQARKEEQEFQDSGRPKW